MKDSIQSHIQDKTSTYLQRAEKMERLAAAAKNSKSPNPKTAKKEREKSPVPMPSGAEKTSGAQTGAPPLGFDT